MIRVYHEGHYGLTDEKVTEGTAILGDDSGNSWIAYESGLFPDEKAAALVQAAQQARPDDYEGLWDYIAWNLKLAGAYRYDCNNYRAGVEPLGPVA